MSAFFYGLGTGFSLLLAIGAQNAFVLKQGLKQQYLFWVALICALSDSLFIFLGVKGFSHVVVQFPHIPMIAQYVGAVFLFGYGLRSFYQALYSNVALAPSQHEPESRLKIIGICLALTWLNPHVYLDTMLLVGSVSTQFTPETHLFACGAILASWLFFFSLAYGAKILLPIFQRPQSWKILDTVIGCIMWGIALHLATS
ncbi:LysE/ArgO family amino acid transporter [Acinetobacter sp. ANC 3791]|uniref:LysE/ArgO family amino acid transporter n=1 Tax=Acinetobacter sp. ANC 3791 TaxID=2529836 RepID=UPI0010396B54|nr:LysE/ArgO family amino acid transporter [Acinetobacter sp. ANC 3791]TCB83956.1 amino acid transporter [Acinetobacter sp. ANC 3791]